MEGAADTASLRKAAARWSLAGDKQLLDLLQNLHERIVTKCQEANSSLEEMVNNLDTASISLQNVNNRLMALSNSQFVESRVYEDDVDVAAQHPPVKEPPKPADTTSELSKLRASLRVLEAYHEPVTILDSDSDTGSEDEEDRLVLKPKDLYAERPLPYVIGSQQWRSKWHAGLVAEESDTDSDTSKARAPSEQYSDSEPERDDVPDRTHGDQPTISTNSSIGSELAIPTMGKPADIAAELARRLGGNVPLIPEPEAESPPVAPGPTKVYKPQQSLPATIFSEEPPPLDGYQSDRSEPPYQPDESDQSDGDVFAELHRAHRPPRAAPAPDRLFATVVPTAYGRKGDVDDDSAERRQPNTATKQLSPLFEDQQDSGLFADKTDSGSRFSTAGSQSVHTDSQPEASVKKPVGGISVFGNNHGAESIGAAILRRNQRKGSTSDEENVEPQQVPNVDINTDTKKVIKESGQPSKDTVQKDLLNDLFSKPPKTKQTNKKIDKASPVKIEKPVNKKVDLFTDDLFDDIDDIFTNVKPVVKGVKETTKKSLFDDEDDDLFATVATSSDKNNSKPAPKSKSIFDSDDDLFSEEKVENVAPNLINGTKSNEASLGTNNDDLFGDASSSNNEVLVTNVAQSKAPVVIKPTAVGNSDYKDDLSNVNHLETVRKEINPIQENTSSKSSKVKSIFDSDSDDDLFSDLKSANINSSTTQISKENVVHNVDQKSDLQNTINKDDIRKMDYNNKIINKEDNIARDDSLFEQIEKPVDSSKQIPTSQDFEHETKNNNSINKRNDNNHKTDNAVTESIQSSSGVEDNVTAHDEDKLLPSTKNEDTLKSPEVLSILSKSNVSKSQFQSPSLFDEDDDLDDIFSKSSDSSKSKKLESNKMPEDKTDKNIISDSKLSHKEISKEAYEEKDKKSDVPIDKIKEIQIQKPEITKKPTSKNDKTEVSEGVSVQSTQQTNKNIVINSLEVSKVPLPSDDTFDYSIPKEYKQEKETENKTEFENVQTNFIQSETLFSDIKESGLGEPDIFSDIFSDVPPEFERPKEPKRSKNVNALFDDDSEDEALFFKKNEIVSDEKPDLSFTSQDDRLFHIFHDEPPAMDVDFTQKSNKNLTSNLETPPDEAYSEVFSSHSKEGTNVKSLLREEKQKESSGSADSESEKIEDEIKKPVGKLKPMNFNINVNTLLPGASPKKTKTYEQVDGQVISTKSTEEVIKDEESKMVKSVSFEGDPESEVLDNKLSKERAKIQVKRRPSTRRARKEAVRKSGIDFGDDSTDNSSSTDISKRDNSTDKSDSTLASNNTIANKNLSSTLKPQDMIEDDAFNDNKVMPSNNFTDHNEVTDATKSDVLDKELKSDVEHEAPLFNDIKTNIVEHTNVDDTLCSDITKKEVSEYSNLPTTFNQRPNVKSKVVYILNDEDIFTDTKPVTNLSDNVQKVTENTQSVAKSKVLNIVDDDDELFKSGASKTSNIGTLGNVYKDVDLKRNEISNFDSDEDIFRASQSKASQSNESKSTTSKNKDEIDKLEAKIDKLFVKTQSAKTKGSLFDDLSDDESELFGSKKGMKNSDTSGNKDVISTIKKEVKLPKVDVKRPLFGDESDDDDLFSVTATKKETSRPSSKPKEISSKPAEPVFEDPLSRLREDDDI